MKTFETRRKGGSGEQQEDSPQRTQSIALSSQHSAFSRETIWWVQMKPLKRRNGGSEGIWGSIQRSALSSQPKKQCYEVNEDLETRKNGAGMSLIRHPDSSR